MQQIDRIYKFCAYQDRSVYETRLKIRSLKKDKKDENLIIEKLIDEKYLDDFRFTEHYVHGKLNSKGWGIAKIKQGLMQKGISNALIQEVLSNIDPDQYLNNMENEMEKWLRNHPDNEQPKPKLIRFLLAKGYSYEQIMKKMNTQDDTN